MVVELEPGGRERGDAARTPGHLVHAVARAAPKVVVVRAAGRLVARRRAGQFDGDASSRARGRWVRWWGETLAVCASAFKPEA